MNTLTETVLTQTLGILLMLAAVAYAVVRVIGWCLRFAPRDPQRCYSAAQKRILLARAGHRCEHHTLLLIRCPQRHRLQADHVMPWSRGGRTTIENGQMLCARHNRRKTNRIPGPLYRWQIHLHRRGSISSPPPRHSWTRTGALAAKSGGPRRPIL